MTLIYLSPHLDDAAFSCGGLIWQQAQAGEVVEVWTICAGAPSNGDLPPFAQSLHARWGIDSAAVDTRREEDRAACLRLGVACRWFDVLDCIYRRDPDDGRPLYASGAAIFGSLHPADQALKIRLSEELDAALPEEAQLMVPLTVGNHVDHQLVRQAARTLNRPLSYYADFPYIVNNENLIGFKLPSGAKGRVLKVSEKGLEVWQQAIACYATQLSTFWPDEEAMRRAVVGFHGRVGGVEIWQRQV